MQLKQDLKRLMGILLLSASLLPLLSAQAQEAGTLAKIKNTKTIVLGVRDSSIPFSYLDDQQSYQGYSIDLCLKAVAAVRRHLGLADLKVVMNPVTSATRIPLMANGTIDLECGSTTNNLERQKQVAFAPTTFVTATRLLVKKSSGIKKLSDMKAKAIALTAGTSNLKLLTQLNADKQMNMQILTGKDHAESFLMLETGRVAAFSTDDILLASLAASSKDPAAYELTKEPLSVEPYGIMMRRDDPAFKAVVDQAIKDVFKSGEINKIYNKWFMAPIPPKGINLHIPMSAELKALINKPSDSGDPAVYAVVPESQKSVGKKK